MREPSRSPSKPELLVFGYPCKLFERESKSGGSKDGCGLIPLNGNKTILIDSRGKRAALPIGRSIEQNEFQGRRSYFIYCNLVVVKSRKYDCRLHLQNHERYKASDDAQWHSDAEGELQERLNAERYRDLAEASSEENENAKRKRAEIYYDYGASPSAGHPVVEAATCEDDAFVVPVELKVPKGVCVPKSSKQHKIIEKTAAFIATHGIQMEIIVNIKQKGNPLFRFLDYNHQLHVYYKHILRMIKEKRYTPSIEEAKIDKTEADALDDEESDDGCDYLHPSLRGSGRTYMASTTESMQSSQIDYCLGKENDVYSTLYKGLVAIYPELASSESKVERESENERKDDEQDAKEAVFDDASWSVDADNAKHLVIVPPPPDLQPTIDRLAEYVARNGQEFENIVRMKRDPRFSFILPDSPYYSYYKAKVQWCQYEDLLTRYYQGTLTAADMHAPQMSHCILFPGKPIVDVEQSVQPADESHQAKKVAEGADHNSCTNGEKRQAEVSSPTKHETASVEQKPRKLVPISFSIKCVAKRSCSPKLVLPQLSEEEDEESEPEEAAQGNHVDELAGTSERAVTDVDESVDCLLESVDPLPVAKRDVGEGKESLQLDRRKRAKLFLNKLNAKISMNKAECKKEREDNGHCSSDSRSSCSDRYSANVRRSRDTVNDNWRTMVLPSSYEKHRHANKRSRRSRSRSRSRQRSSKRGKRSRSRTKHKRERSRHRYS
uniref:SURP motif domain-containing protein n=1 Tax=Trichuris muris TaxID=70415 RepID=A0A5S6Q3W4_TRIMR